MGFSKETLMVMAEVTSMTPSGKWQDLPDTLPEVQRLKEMVLADTYQFGRPMAVYNARSGALNEIVKDTRQLMGGTHNLEEIVGRARRQKEYGYRVYWFLDSPIIEGSDLDTILHSRKRKRLDLYEKERRTIEKFMREEMGQ